MEVNSGKYPSLSPTLRRRIVLVYATPMQKKIVYFYKDTKKWSEIKLVTCGFDSSVNRTRYSLLNWPISACKKHYSLVWSLLLENNVFLFYLFVVGVSYRYVKF